MPQCVAALVGLASRSSTSQAYVYMPVTASFLSTARKCPCKTVHQPFLAESFCRHFVKMQTCWYSMRAPYRCPTYQLYCECPTTVRQRSYIKVYRTVSFICMHCHTGMDLPFNSHHANHYTATSRYLAPKHASKNLYLSVHCTLLNCGRRRHTGV